MLGFLNILANTEHLPVLPFEMHTFANAIKQCNYNTEYNFLALQFGESKTPNCEFDPTHLHSCSALPEGLFRDVNEP